MITNVLPNDWRDLQAQVARILAECGFAVEVEKKIQTVRGEVEIDVYAEEAIKGRTYSILCECKYWRANVPQQVIHGFRTVIADAGAHRGYIISTSGFQSGAFSASELTNLDLVTWPEFQSQFCQTWLENYLSPTITKRMDRLVGFTEPLVETWMCAIPDEDVEVVKALRTKYQEVGALAMSLSTYGHLFMQRAFPVLPIRSQMDAKGYARGDIPEGILDATAYREFLEHMINYGDQGVREFQAVRERNGV